EQIRLARRGLENLGMSGDVFFHSDPEKNRYAVPGDSFDLVFSDNVIEHVSDLGGLIEEIRRITKPGGVGVHIFPSKWAVVEPHVRMPLIHWLPKSRSIRLPLIRFAMASGFDPAWVENRDKKVHEAAEEYFQYLQDHTYYRPIWEILKSFESRGFECHTSNTDEAIISKPLFQHFSTLPGPARLFGLMSLLFHTTVLRTIKTP
ncbi:MAG: methyltransferase domain-containing protein, partial [Gammaproteobacteria bacterium]|nr:methyltransferase domain-containing protein [Gammaproteobacteria bacterium]